MIKEIFTTGIIMQRHRGVTMCFWLLGALALALGGLTAAGAAEQTGEREKQMLDREFEFASGLIKLQLPEYAESVVNKVLLLYPNESDRANVIRAEALIARRRFKQAEDIVAAMPKESPKAQAIMLALADGYYQINNMERCRGLYNAFFQQYTNRVPTDPDLLRFYRDAAYKFGQMLAHQNEPRAAAEIYELVLQVLADKEMLRQIRLEQAELLLISARSAAGADREALIRRAESNCTEVVWGATDIWFGRAIIGMSQIEIYRNHKDQARELLKANIRMMKAMDEEIKQRDYPISESPYAGARSQLGGLYLEEADILVGTRAPREAEALSYFERAEAELEAIWDLIVRLNQRDQTIAKDAAGRASLSGSTSQRQKPFEDIAAAFKKFEDALAAAGANGWDAATTEQANKLKEKTRAVATKIADYKKDLGVTPTAEMALGDDFKGWSYLKYAQSFLVGEEQRKQRATELYVEALQEFYNVFIGYPGTDWSQQSSAKVTLLKEKLKQLTGKDVNIEIGQGGKEKIALVAFKEGQSLFSRKEYAKAVDQFLKGLNDAPESDQSIVALANLMECYAALRDTVHVKMMAHYLCERFTTRPDAAQSLLRIGRIYFDEKNLEVYAFIYDQYLKSFPNHSSAPIILYSLGEQRWMVKDYEGAIEYYKRITKNYVKTVYFVKALNRIGWSHYLAKNYPQAVAGFTAYLAEAQPSSEKAQAKLCLADACQQMGQFTNALTNYRELAEWLAAKDTDTVNVKYAQNASELAKNQEVLEQATYFQAFCTSRIGDTPEQLAASRKQAAELYRKFVEQFPSSKMAPAALSSLGAVLLGDGKSDEAAKAYEQLSAKYPESDAGQNAKYAMIRSLLEIEQKDKARQVFAEMMAQADKYPVAQFARLAQLMLERSEYESAVQAFNQVIKMSTDKADIERSLYGLGEAYTAMKRYEDAAKNLNDLVVQYPRSGLFYKARFMLGSALEKMDKLDEAMEVLREVFSRASDQKLINQATIALAGIQLARGDKNGALASYQRIVLLGKADDEDTRPLYREALAKSIPIFLEMGRWQDVLENCDLYTTYFPAGEQIVEVRKWREKAIMSRTTAGGQ
jgi:TolA-binding protein